MSLSGTLEGAIRTALLNMSAVTTLVGTGDDARIRPYMLDDRDDKTEEHIIIEVDDANPQNDITGLGGLTYATVNISCRAITPAQANALAIAVKRNGTSPGTGLAGYTGSGTTFDAVLEDEVTGRALWGDGSQRAWYTVEQTYIMSYSEDV
ncbi:hypothetical protein [Petrachloros mirabilis]